MKSAPFPVSMMLVVIYLALMIPGGVFGAMFEAVAFGGIIAGALCGILTTPFGEFLYQVVSRFFASASGVEGPAPTGFSFPVRMIIATIISFIVAYGVMTLGELNISFITGALISVVTSVIFSIINLSKILKD